MSYAPPPSNPAPGNGAPQLPFPTNPTIDLAFIESKIAEMSNRYNRNSQQESVPDINSRDLGLVPENGCYQIRILPGAFYQITDPQTGQLVWRNKPFFVESAVHRFGDRRYFCPNTVAKQSCCVCAYCKRLWDDGSQKAQEMRNKIKRQFIYMMNVIHRNRRVFDPQTRQVVTVANAGPLKAEFGTKIHQKILNRMADQEIINGGGLIGLKGGFDFFVRMKKVGGFRNYDDSDAGRTICDAGTEQEIQHWMQNLIDLESLIQLPEPGVLEKELAQFVNASLAAGSTDNTGNFAATLAIPSAAPINPPIAVTTAPPPGAPGYVPQQPAYQPQQAAAAAPPPGAPGYVPQQAAAAPTSEVTAYVPPQQPAPTVQPATHVPPAAGPALDMNVDVAGPPPVIPTAGAVDAVGALTANPPAPSGLPVDDTPEGFDDLLAAMQKRRQG